MRLTQEEYQTLKNRNPKQRLQALGRMKKGKRNKTEERYEQHLELQKRAGEILWYKFEAVKFRVGDKCFWSPDFMVMTATGLLECHDVKGSRDVFEDDARVKMKAVAEMFPLRVIAVYPSGSGWDIEEF